MMIRSPVFAARAANNDLDWTLSTADFLFKPVLLVTRSRSV